MTCASEDSDQPGHLHSLIRIFAVCFMDTLSSLMFARTLFSLIFANSLLRKFKDLANID